MRLRHTNHAPRRGATLVESAVVIALVFLMLFGIFEYGRLLMVLNLTEYAAREGARTAVVQFTANRSAGEIAATTDLVRNATRAAMGGQDYQVDGFNVEVFRINPQTGAETGSWNAAMHTEPIAVRITGTYKPVVSLVLPIDVPVRIQATMGSEAN